MKTLVSRFFKSRITQIGLVLAVVAAAAATLAWSLPEAYSYKLEGAWVTKVPGTPLLWSQTFSPDPSGRSAVMSGEIHVPIVPSIVIPGLFPDLEYYTPFVGQVNMTGPDTFEFSSVYYGMKKGFPFNQVVLIGQNNGQGRFTAPGRCVVTNHLACYAPSADADHDGLPDPGVAPALCLPPSVGICTRLPMLPPCTLAE